MDLKCIEAAKGGYYYKEHLASLGERVLLKRNTKLTNNTKITKSNGSSIHHIDTSVSAANLRLGGSNGDMLKEPILNKSSRNSSRSPTGSLLNLEINGGLDLNPAVAQIYTTFKIGDQVNIDLDFEIVQSLQVGHGKRKKRFLLKYFMK
jgi:hypothetical protein